MHLVPLCLAAAVRGDAPADADAPLPIAVRYRASTLGEGVGG